MSRIVELRAGGIVRTSATEQTLSQLATQEPENGVYLVARTYRDGLVLELDAHFDRLERSAALLGRSVPIPRRRVREILAELQRDLGDIRFRVTAVLDTSVWYRISVEPASEIAEEIRRDGVVCDVARGAARQNAEVKSTRWMHRRTHLGGEAVYEHLLADREGVLFEGATSNFYGVVANTLRTAGSGVLEGIARRTILALAPEIVRVELSPITLGEVTGGQLSEAFLSSATRGIVPIRRIGDTVIGPPGSVTVALISAWNQWLNGSLQPLLVGPIRRST